MNFGQILKNVLDKNHEVFIPTIGLLAYDKATSKLNLDTYGSSSIEYLTSLISDIRQTSEGEAKGILIQEVEAMKNAIHNNGHFAIDGLGEISSQNGAYVFEPKKTLFPTNFFETGNFNPNAFSNNTHPKKDEIMETPPPPVVEEKLHTEEPQNMDLFSSPLDSLLTEDVSEKKTKKKTTKKEETTKTDFVKMPKAQIMPEIKEEFIQVTKPIDEPVQEVMYSETEPDISIKTQDDVNPYEETAETSIASDINAEENFNEKEEIEEDFFEEKHLIEDSVEPEIAEEIVSQDIAIQETEKKIEKIVIDEPRLNIGKARYDEGYYNYGNSFFNHNENNNKWKLVGGIIFALFLVAFLIPWVIASMNGKYYLGLKPLWNKEGKKTTETKKESIPTMAQKADSMRVDSSNPMASMIKKDTIPASTNMTQPTATNQKAASTASLTTNTPSSLTTQTKTKNTQPKTPSPIVDSKKSVAVATKKESKPVIKEVKKVEVAPSDKNDTNKTRPIIAKKEKPVNVIGKPYATANYTKGNTYVSYGNFKIPTAAAKLRQMMKSKAGVETDIILVDGTYRVVVPYINKEKAKEAAKELPTATIFE